MGIGTAARAVSPSQPQVEVETASYVATYLFGRKMGERGTRKRAGEEVREQRELGEKGAQEVRDQLGHKSTGDYIRGKDI